MAFRLTAAAIPGLALALLPASAFAHGGPGDAHGLIHGFMHPLGGFDHILAMVSVGLLAATLGGRSLWCVPASFVAMMAAGGALAVGGFTVPFVEIGIASSVIVLGLAVALQWPLPTVAAVTLAGFFAVFHGAAHGAEMPAGAGGLGYGLGFVAATALLHAAGLGIGVGLRAAGPRRAGAGLQAGGGAMALAGVMLLVGRL